MKAVLRTRHICQDDTKWSKRKFNNWMNNEMTRGLLAQIECFNSFCKKNNMECEICIGFAPPGTYNGMKGERIDYPTIHMFVQGPDNIETITVQ